MDMRQPTAGAAARKTIRMCRPSLLGLARAHRRGQARAVNVARKPALARRRAIVAAVCGSAAADVVMQITTSWSVAALSGFDVAALVFVLWGWAGLPSWR